MRRSRWYPCGAFLLAAVVVGFACPAGAADTKAAPVKVRVASLPLTNYTPLLVARDKGWFAEEQLDVSWTMVSQGALSVEAVYGGSAEFGGSAILEPMIARGNGLDVMFAAASTRIRSAPPDNNALLVLADGPIRAPTDLSGKKISSGLINSVNYLHMVEWLHKKGVDPKTVQFLEIPFPQMADALYQKRLDAVWNVEPFVTVMQKSGKVRVLGYPYQDNIPAMDITAYIAKESWVKAHTDVARRFRRTIERATTHLNGAPKDERNTWIAKYSGVKPELVAEMNLPSFTTEFNVDSLRANLDLAIRQKLVKPFDVTVMIWKP
jgi:NitT/TauT family transport system substrate-binding protein